MTAVTIHDDFSRQSKAEREVIIDCRDAAATLLRELLAPAEAVA